MKYNRIVLLVSYFCFAFVSIRFASRPSKVTWSSTSSFKYVCRWCIHAWMCKWFPYPTKICHQPCNCVTGPSPKGFTWLRIFWRCWQKWLSMFHSKNPSKKTENPMQNICHPCFELCFMFILRSMMVNATTKNPNAPSWKIGFLSGKSLQKKIYRLKAVTI